MKFASPMIHPKLWLQALLEQFLAVCQHQESYELQTQSLPGVGKRLVPELIATLGPRQSHRRFEPVQDLSNLEGCNPITQASGKWQKVRMRTACVKSLRCPFPHWSFASLTRSKWAWAYYRYRRNGILSDILVPEKVFATRRLWGPLVYTIARVCC